MVTLLEGQTLDDILDMSTSQDKIKNIFAEPGNDDKINEQDTVETRLTYCNFVEL